MEIEKEVLAFDHAVQEEAGYVVGDLLLNVLLLCMGGVGS